MEAKALREEEITHKTKTGNTTPNIKQKRLSDKKKQKLIETLNIFNNIDKSKLSRAIILSS